MKDGNSALDAMELAISILENCSVTNAGMGSNLSLHGHVECDAGAMSFDASGGTLFGAVAAAPGILNPIKAAVLLSKQSRKRLSHGRVAPIMLAGPSAKAWAHKEGLQTCDKEDLITEASLSKYKYYKGIVDGKATKRQRLEYDSKLNDTVGCVVIDQQGTCAAGVSSGGIHLKHEGRIGEAAVLGAGCYVAQNADGVRVGCSASGVGESIMMALLAKECADGLLKCNIEPSTLLTTLLEKSLLETEEPKDGGIACIRRLKSGELQVCLAHCASSFAVGYQAAESDPEVTFMRNNTGRTVSCLTVSI